jgi:hypothetical protein
MVGFNLLFGKGKGLQDENKHWWDFVKGLNEKNIDVVAMNTTKNLNGAVFILNPEMIQELIKKEHLVATKSAIANKINLGFFWKNGDHAMK